MPEPSTCNLSAGRPWTSVEIRRLRELAPLGAATAAAVLGRPVGSVKQIAHRKRISLRRPGSARGTILGQPRGVSYTGLDAAADVVRAARALRAGVLDGSIDPAELEDEAALLRKLARGEVELCSGCGLGPAVTKRTGLCTVCHLRGLTAAHERKSAEADAQRGLWAARQAASRETRQRAAATT